MTTAPTTPDDRLTLDAPPARIRVTLTPEQAVATIRALNAHVSILMADVVQAERLGYDTPAKRRHLLDGQTSMVRALARDIVSRG